MPLLEGQGNGDDEVSEESDEPPMTHAHVISNAVMLMAFGALVCGFFADPMVRVCCVTRT